MLSLATVSLSSHRRRFRRVLAAALALLVGGPGALAQTPSPSPTPGSVAIELVGQPVWHSPGDDLGLRVRIENRGSAELEGFRMVVGVYDRVTTRSGLQTPPTTTPPSSMPFERTEVLEPGGAIEIELNEPLASFPTMAAATAGGVYPLTFGITTSQGTALASSYTYLVYYPQKPEVPLNLALLLPLNSVPERLPDGSFISASEGATLPDAISATGWLRGYVETLAEATTEDDPTPGRRRGEKRDRPEPAAAIPPLHLSIAPTGRLTEELADLGNGSRTTSGSISSGDLLAEDARLVITGLRDLLGKAEVQTVLTPYAFPDIPTLVHEDVPVEHLAQQNTTAKKVLNDVLGITLGGGWYFPPAGRLDSMSLAQIQLLDEGQHVFLSDRTVEPLDLGMIGCPDLSQTFTCAARVRTIQGPSDALIADPGLTDILAELPGASPDRLTLQRFFAETAMIREEVPGVSGRVVHATIPSLWHPPPELSQLFFEGLREAPWVRTVTGAEAVDLAAETRDRNVVAEADPIASAPSSLFFDQVQDSTELIDSYGEIVPSDNQRITRLRRNLLVATSRSWWRRPLDGELYLEGSEEEAEDELDKISIESPPGFTFTDRQGELQFRVTNGTEYPVRLSLSLLSPNLTLSQRDLTDVYPPGSSLIRVEAEARTSGDFPIAVRITTPDGYQIDEQIIKLRSTSLNRIALALTIGALAFLMLFYMTRGIRRKRRHTERPSD